MNNLEPEIKSAIDYYLMNYKNIDTSNYNFEELTNEYINECSEALKIINNYDISFYKEHKIHLALAIDDYFNNGTIDNLKKSIDEEKYCQNEYMDRSFLLYYDIRWELMSKRLDYIFKCQKNDKYQKKIKKIDKKIEEHERKYNEKQKELLARYNVILP